MKQQIRGGFPGRVGLTAYYIFVWALAIRRCSLAHLGPEPVGLLLYEQTAVYAALALSSWWLLRNLRWASDRIAALLFGLFYAAVVGARLFKGTNTFVLVMAECAIISAGMVAMIVGLLRAIENRKQRHSEIGNPSP